MKTISYQPIGIIHSPFKENVGVPRQAVGASDINRPNPIGLSVICLESVDNNILNISGVDMADGSPLLDIKPYVPDLNPTKDVRIGWLTDKVDRMNKSKSGDR